MNLTKNQRNLLNQLSKDVFGSSSRWQKFIEKGVKQVVTEEKEETIPAEEGKEATTRKISVPKLNDKGQTVTHIIHHTPESILEIMMEFKKQKDAWVKQMEEIQATNKKLQEERAEENRILEEAKKAQGSIS